MRFLKIGSSIAVFDFDESGIVFFLDFTKLIRLPDRELDCPRDSDFLVSLLVL